MGPVRRDRPEVAIEWLDVTIDIKVSFSALEGDVRKFIVGIPFVAPRKLGFFSLHWQLGVKFS